MEDSGGRGASKASTVGQAIGFITEFNQNALIFSEQIALLLGSVGLSSDGETSEDDDSFNTESVRSNPLV